MPRLGSHITSCSSLWLGEHHPPKGWHDEGLTVKLALHATHAFPMTVQLCGSSFSLPMTLTVSSLYRPASLRLVSAFPVPCLAELIPRWADVGEKLLDKEG